MPLLLFLSHLICFPPASLSLPASQHPRQRQRRLLNLFDLASDVPFKWNNKGEKMCIRVCKVFHLLEVSARVCVCAHVLDSRPAFITNLIPPPICSQRRGGSVHSSSPLLLFLFVCSLSLSFPSCPPTPLPPLPPACLLLFSSFHPQIEAE